MIAALDILDRLGRQRYADGWVPTGAVADALGCSVDVAAARLRGAERRDLCVVRRSLVYPTTWRLSRDGARFVAAQQGRS